MRNYYSAIKKTADTRNDMVESRKHYVKRKKPDLKSYTPYDSTQRMLEKAKVKLGQWYQGIQVRRGPDHRGHERTFWVDGNIQVNEN